MESEKLAMFILHNSFVFVQSIYDHPQRLLTVRRQEKT